MVHISFLVILWYTYHFYSYNGTHTISSHTMVHVPFLVILWYMYHFYSYNGTHIISSHTMVHVPFLVILWYTYHFYSYNCTRIISSHTMVHVPFLVILWYFCFMLETCFWGQNHIITKPYITGFIIFLFFLTYDTGLGCYKVTEFPPEIYQQAINIL